MPNVSSISSEVCVHVIQPTSDALSEEALHTKITLIVMQEMWKQIGHLWRNKHLCAANG